MTWARKFSKKPEIAKDSEEDIDEFLFGADLEDELHAAQQFTKDTHSHSLAFQASVLESRIINSKKPKKVIKCVQCIDVLIENELIDDSFIRFKATTSKITQPCKSTFQVCKFIDTYLNFFKDRNMPLDAAVLKILRKLPFDTLYTGSDFDKHLGSDASHKYDFVKRVVEIYLQMKSVQNAKDKTLQTHDKPIRHDYKTLIKYAGQ